MILALDWGSSLEVPEAALHIAPGLCHATPPRAILRGEETQLLGLHLANGLLDGLVCLPGTHSKWVQCASGEVQGFRTSMTGELFALAGLLIGSEVAHAVSMARGQPITLCGEPDMLRCYATALALYGASAHQADGEATAWHGLALIALLHGILPDATAAVARAGGCFVVCSNVKPDVIREARGRVQPFGRAFS